MGVIDFLLSCGMSGMIYSVFSGQPMTFIGPTGLTLCFTAALFQFCARFGLAFFPMYTWVGLWTSLMLVLLSAGNACRLIKHCTVGFERTMYKYMNACTATTAARTPPTLTPPSQNTLHPKLP